MVIAIFHLSIQIIKRSHGRSAVAAAAYRSGEKLTNDWDGLTHDYTKKGGVIYSEILLPAHAPPEYADRSALWNAVERVEKNRRAQLAREINVALPVELPREEQIKLVREYVKDNFINAGMCADIAVHDTGGGNPHAHIMLTIAGGGALYWFKLRKKKPDTKGPADLDDYDYGEEDDDEEYETEEDAPTEDSPAEDDKG